MTIAFTIILISLAIAFALVMYKRAKANENSDNPAQPQASAGKRKVDFKHLLIRLAVLVLIPVLSGVLVYYINSFDEGVSDGTYPHRGNPMMGIIFLAIFELMLMGGYLIVESTWLHLQEKYAKRNANLLIIGALVLWGLLVCVLSF